MPSSSSHARPARATYTRILTNYGFWGKLTDASSGAYRKLYIRLVDMGSPGQLPLYGTQSVSPTFVSPSSARAAAKFWKYDPQWNCSLFWTSTPQLRITNLGTEGEAGTTPAEDATLSPPTPGIQTPVVNVEMKPVQPCLPSPHPQANPLCDIT
ncbi:hypothetical protein CVT26_012880 [Gymnopilus dilepis]|uniref:Uncharacterized protein n=1 Tax=Gymnopilus dilepis TaxID=231916 RepID=A0A409YNV0_9AGAR|nr:hypothetical protein CVT26_012880 [Gymnopilus dilepis]